MKRFFQFLGRHKIVSVLVLCAVLAAATGGTFFFLRPHPHPPSTNPDVVNPVLAVEFLEKFNPKSVYYTLSAHDYLVAKKPQWITDHNTPEALQDFFTAGQDGAYFRKLDRQFHFDVILLCGDPSEFQPLLNYLVTQPDFTHVYLDHTSIIYMRSPAAKWSPESLGPLHDRFANYPRFDRAQFLTMLSSKLDAAGDPTRARQYLNESLSLDKDSPLTWTQLAHNAAQTGDVKSAMDDTDRALKLDENDYYALITRIHLLESLNRNEEALHFSSELLKTHPDDTMLLYKHVMIADKAFNYTEEIAALTHLIDLVSAQKRSVAGFRIYLGQAYERDGQVQPALDEFQKALDEGTLSDEQQKGIKMQIDSIKKQFSGMR